MLYVASWVTDEVLRYDAASGAFVDVFVTAGAGGLDFPHTIAFGPDGNFYVTSAENGEVLRYDGTSGLFMDVFVSSESYAGHKTGFFFGPDNTLYVSSGAAILRYNANTGSFLDAFVAPVQAENGGLSYAEKAQFGPDGNLYVTCWQSDSILRYNGTTGEFIDRFGGNFSVNAAYGITLGPDGRVYIANWFGSSVRRYDATSGNSSTHSSRITVVVCLPLRSLPSARMATSTWLVSHRTGSSLLMAKRVTSSGILCRPVAAGSMSPSEWCLGPTTICT